MKNNIILLIIVALIFVFMGYRVDFTPDYFNYENFFDKFHGASIDTEIRTEVGFQLINLILPSYRSVIIVISLLFCIVCIFLSQNQNY